MLSTADAIVSFHEGNRKREKKKTVSTTATVHCSPHDITRQTMPPAGYKPVHAPGMYHTINRDPSGFTHLHTGHRTGTNTAPAHSPDVCATTHGTTASEAAISMPSPSRCVPCRGGADGFFSTSRCRGSRTWRFPGCCPERMASCRRGDALASLLVNPVTHRRTPHTRAHGGCDAVGRVPHRQTDRQTDTHTHTQTQTQTQTQTHTKCIRNELDSFLIIPPMQGMKTQISFRDQPSSIASLA